MDSSCATVYCLRSSRSSSMVEILIYLPNFAQGNGRRPVQYKKGTFRSNEILRKYSLDLRDENYNGEIAGTSKDT